MDYNVAGPAWLAVWGFGSTGSEAGCLGVFASRQEADGEVARFERANDNPACGAWVRHIEAE